MIKDFPKYEPLLYTKRKNTTDNVFWGIFGVYNKNGVIKKIGEPKGKFWLRSLFKPIQARLIDEKIIKHFNFSEKELAIMQASHSGETVHIELVQSILNKIGLKEEDLLCPPIKPLNTKEFKGISKIHNNCSGKHSMVLSYCVYNNLDIKNYTNYNHPSQIKIKENLLNLAETNEFEISKDGCTMPIYGLEFDSISKAFLNLYEDDNILKKSYMNNPYLIGGKDDYSIRTDTKIMQLNKNLISKVGAGGFIFVYNNESKEILVLKMAQNNNPEREILTLEVLRRLNWVKDKFYDDLIYTENGEAIGNFEFNF